MLMFVTFMCMVFHNQSVVKKTKERNFNLTKNQGYIPIPIYQIIFTFNNIKPRKCIAIRKCIARKKSGHNNEVIMLLR